MRERLANLVWGAPLLFAFLATGFWLNARSAFFPFRKCRYWFKHTIGTLFHSAKATGSSITQRQALTSALAACLGTGNIVGVATAMVLGGPGAIFWMCASSIFGTMTIATENILGTQYRYRTASGHLIGGPIAYLERGVGSKFLAKLYAGLLCMAGLGIGNMAQSNALADAAKSLTGTSTKITAVVVAILLAMVIFGGIKRIARFTEVLVPLMTILFLGASLYIIILKYKKIPSMCLTIANGAFGFPALGGGLAGYSVKAAMRYGVARGVFSNEAGLGTSALVHATAQGTPQQQGMWGIAEVAIDTLVMCSVTAAVYLLTDSVQPGGPIGVALANAAYASVFGKWGAHFVSLCIILFAFATLSGWAYYGEQGFVHLFGKKNGYLYRIAWIIAAAIGCTMRLETIWAWADILNACMAVPNLIGIWILSLRGEGKIIGPSDQAAVGPRQTPNKSQPAKGVARPRLEKLAGSTNHFSSKSQS